MSNTDSVGLHQQPKTDQQQTTPIITSQSKVIPSCDRNKTCGRHSICAYVKLSPHTYTCTLPHQCMKHDAGSSRIYKLGHNKQGRTRAQVVHAKCQMAYTPSPGAKSAQRTHVWLDVRNSSDLHVSRCLGGTVLPLQMHPCVHTKDPCTATDGQHTIRRRPLSNHQPAQQPHTHTQQSACI